MTVKTKKHRNKFGQFKNMSYLCSAFREKALRRWAAPQHKTSFLHSVCTILASNDRDLAQLVAHTSGGREVAGSSPVIPTKRKRLRIIRFSVFFLFISEFYSYFVCSHHSTILFPKPFGLLETEI